MSRLTFFTIMDRYSKMFNSVNQKPQRPFLPLKHIRTGTRLPKYFKVVLEQASDTATPPNHHGVGVDEERTSSENSPAQIRGNGQSRHISLLFKTRFFLRGKPHCNPEF